MYYSSFMEYDPPPHYPVPQTWWQETLIGRYMERAPHPDFSVVRPEDTQDIPSSDAPVAYTVVGVVPEAYSAPPLEDRARRGYDGFVLEAGLHWVNRRDLSGLRFASHVPRWVQHNVGDWLDNHGSEWKAVFVSAAAELLERDDAWNAGTGEAEADGHSDTSSAPYTINSPAAPVVTAGEASDVQP
jgi:hypothetical protein